VETSARKRRIVIVGGGFVGLFAALHLDRTIAREPGIEVTLIDPQDFALFTPMLHEVASGALDPSSTGIDLANRTVTISYGLDPRSRTVEFDQLLIAAGSRTRFPPGFRQHSFGMKTTDHALVLRNWLIGLLERAEIEKDAARQRALLTIVVAGGGFSGVETIGAIHDFLRDVARHYSRVSTDRISFVLVEPQERLLPEFEAPLARYAESRLRAAGIDVRLGKGVGICLPLLKCKRRACARR